jgi:hypothetical protein
MRKEWQTQCLGILVGWGGYRKSKRHVPYDLCTLPKIKTHTLSQRNGAFTTSLYHRRLQQGHY